METIPNRVKLSSKLHASRIVCVFYFLRYVHMAGGTWSSLLQKKEKFRVTAADIEAKSSHTKAILINSYNPTGAVLAEADIRAIAEVAQPHDRR